MATRKSTPKHVVVTIGSNVVVYGPASRTDCKNCERAMNRPGRSPSVWVRKA